MELRVPAQPLRLTLALVAALAALALAAPAGAAAAPELERPKSQTQPPRGYELSARGAIAIASRADKVRAERPRHRRFAPTAYTRGPGRWQVSWFDGDREVAQVRVDDGTGAVLEAWTGDQVAWTMARGYEGAFGRKLNAPYVWIPLCVLFLLPFVDPRRPLRLLHLDLLVLLSFSASHVFFNRGEVGTSAPLVVPVLLYLLARLLWSGFRPAERRQRLVPVIPLAWLAVAIVVLVGFRVALNVVDSNVIDVGYAGVLGADRIADGKGIYGPGFSEDVPRGDTYGPVTYLAYLPFEQLLPWRGTWDDLPAAHGAALLFDLATLAGLVLLGMRLRGGREGRELGLALGFAWAAYPYALFSLQTNSNDTLPGLLIVLALLAMTLPAGRRGAAAVGSGVAIALAGCAKFAALGLLPLFARGAGRRPRELALFGVAAVAVMAATIGPLVPDGGLREIYDRTIGYQASRPAPFSIWGQVDGLEALQSATQAAAALLAAAVFFVPRRRDLVQVAALAAAVLIALQLGVSYWFYLYVAWFAPLALVAFFAPLRGAGPDEPGVQASRREPERALA